MPNSDLIDSRLYPNVPPSEITNTAWKDASAGDLLADHSGGEKAHKKMKKLMRCGVPDGIRSLVWGELLDRNHFTANGPNYKNALGRVFGTSIPLNLSPPLFGGHIWPDCLALNANGVQAAQRILTIIGHDFPNLEYCPFIPPIISILLHHLTPDEVLGTTTTLIQTSLKSGDWSFFPTYRRDIHAFFSGLSDYLLKHQTKLCRHIQSLQQSSPPSPQEAATLLSSSISAFRLPIWAGWLSNLFIGALPLPILFRIFDAFLSEGFKILYRVCIAMLVLKRTEILACKTYEECLVLFRVDVPTTPFDEERLLAMAYTLTLKRDDILAHRCKKLAAVSDASLHTPPFFSSSPKEAAVAASVHCESLASPPSPVSPMFYRLKPTLSEHSAFALDEDWVNLWSWIPPRHRLLDIKLAFTTQRDGRNLHTLYDSLAKTEPLLLLIETRNGCVFGAFISKAICASKDDRPRFTGTGETFLFSLNRDDIRKFQWIGAPVSTSESGPDNVNMMETNTSLFILAGKSELAVGGGGGGYGIWINSQLTKVTSNTCATFNNPPLGGPGTKGQEQEIHVLEMWTFL